MIRELDSLFLLYIISHYQRSRLIPYEKQAHTIFPLDTSFFFIIILFYISVLCIFVTRCSLSLASFSMSRTMMLKEMPEILQIPETAEAMKWKKIKKYKWILI